MREIIDIRDLTKKFGGTIAVDHVSLAFSEGKITGLIGPNGAGKTTLFDLMTGFLRPDGGSISYRGEKIDNLQPWEISRMGIGRLFQDVRVFRKMTIIENMLVGLQDHKENGVGSPFMMLSRRGIKRVYEARQWLKFVGMMGREETYAENLSFGQQKLLAIARLLARGCDTLLLDEPTAGVDPGMFDLIFELIRNLASEGKTVVVVEHDMRLIPEISDWIYLMDKGQIILSGFPGDVMADSAISKLYFGT